MRFSLKFLDNLIFLPQLEVHLAQLILKNGIQVGFLLSCGGILGFCLLAFFLRNQKVVFFDAFKFTLGCFLALFQEVLGTRGYLKGSLELLDFRIAILKVLHGFQVFVPQFLVLCVQHVTIADDLELFLLEDLQLFLQIRHSVLSLLKLVPFFGEFTLQLFDLVLLLLDQSPCCLILSG